MRTWTRLGAVDVQDAPDGVRPVDIALGNDGIHSDGWLSEVSVFGLGHDGTGWAVIPLGAHRHAHHRVRLWDLRSAGFASSLPVGGSRVLMDPELKYELRLLSGEWVLFEG